MTRRTTIKDIATKAKVSLGTVHCALAGKSGVGEATRQRILEIARQQNYRPNAVAASLKRKAAAIVAAFPEPVAENRFYFPYIWQGVRDCLTAQRDFNIHLVEVPYRMKFGNREDELARLFDAGKLHGLVTVGYMDDFGQASLARFIRKNIPVVLVGDDMPHSGRLCGVMPDYTVIGRILAELLTRHLPPDKTILAYAGNPDMPSHYLLEQGFVDYLRETGRNNPVLELHAGAAPDVDRRHIQALLRENPGIAACYSVNARGSVVLGQALRDSGRTDILAVGSDLFPENNQLLKDGVFCNLLHKNPYHQAYTAAQLLVDRILRDRNPESDVVYVSSEVVFRSALPMYNDNYLSQPTIFARS